MAESKKIAPGTPVRFTMGPLGGGDNFEFTVYKGEAATYVRPHQDQRLPRWHIVEVTQDKGDVKFEVPVHEDHFEVAR